MIKSKVFFLIVSIIFYSIASFGQTNPPPMAMPQDSTVILVDKIIEVTNHERYFVDYCTKKIEKYALENNWTPEKESRILLSIKFKYYNSTIYNSYAFYSVDQLKILLNALTLINNNTKSHLTMVLTNSMMQSNLDLFIEGVIEGKYVTSK
ncbi:MAG: hypothetical protein ABIN97_05035 [Ginsengibacter sp.]